MTPNTGTPGKLSFSASSRSAVASWILTGIALFLVLKLHLLSALLAGLLIHELVRLLAPLVEKRLSSKGARLVALATLSIITVALLILFTLGIFAFFKSDTGNREALLDKTDHILTDARTKLPPWIVDNLPSNVDALKSFAGGLGRRTFQRDSARRKRTHAFLRPQPGGHGDRSIDFSARGGAGNQPDAPVRSRSFWTRLPVRPCFPADYLCPGENLQPSIPFLPRFSWQGYYPLSGFICR